MTTKTTNLTLIGILILTFLAGAVAYPSLPAQVASHWNAAGEADGYMSKFWGIFLLPLIMVVVFFLYFLIPKIDPMKKNIESFRKYYNGFWLFVFIFFAYIFFLTLAWNFGYQFNFTFAIIPALALLFFLVGIVIGKSKRNWFFGIRTPWTLSNDTVWEKTNRLGGKLFKLAAVIALGGLFFQNAIAIIFLIAPVIVFSLVTVVYSYFEYKKIDH